MTPQIVVIGHRGMLGQALMRAMPKPPKSGPAHVIVAAGLVGGIRDNMARPVNYLRENLQMALGFIGRAHESGVGRLVYVGSSCMYPRGCRQPMRETDLWTGPVEPTNAGYAVAKLAGEMLCRAYRVQHGRDYRTGILCNLYGAEDRGFNEPDRAHVIPALVQRFRKARDGKEKVVTLMGTGRALREFMHVDDAARGILTYLEADKAPGTVNIGSGEEVTVKALAEGIAELVGYHGRIKFSANGEDGMERKVLDSRAVRALGWKPSVRLWDGLESVIREVGQ